MKTELKQQIKEMKEHIRQFEEGIERDTKFLVLAREMLKVMEDSEKIERERHELDKKAV